MEWMSLIAGIIVLAKLISRATEKEKQRQAAMAKRKAEEEALVRRHKEEQERYRTQMIYYGDQALDRFESLPKHLSTAERHLNQAEVDFADGAFAPFWDSIEEAAKALGHFDEGVRGINDNASRYTKLINTYEGTPPEFSLERQSVAKLGGGTGSAERMRAVVRKARPNFQFATIYEQRKTNQILVAGFKSLAHALGEMTKQITASIDDLASSVDGMTSTLNESPRPSGRDWPRREPSPLIPPRHRAERRRSGPRISGNRFEAGCRIRRGPKGSALAAGPPK